mgnify:CR=1 FL=1
MSNEIVHADSAPKPVGAYAHARRVGNLLFTLDLTPLRAGPEEEAGASAAGRITAR